MKPKSSQMLCTHPAYPIFAAVVCLICYIFTFYPLSLGDFLLGGFASLMVWALLQFVMPAERLNLFVFSRQSFAKECLYRIRRLSRVQAVGVSREKARIERQVRDILAYISRHPHQENEVKTTLRTCIYTTESLVLAWKETEKPNPTGANVRVAKERIKKGLEEISLTLDGLFDSLFAAKAMDVSAQIQAAKVIIDLDKR